jgi:hypothetical protein
LDSLVGVCGIAKILIGNPEGTALVARDQVSKPVAGLVDRAPLEEAADFDGELCILRTGRGCRPPGARPRRQSAGRFGPAWRVGTSYGAVIHKETTLAPLNRLQFTR